MERIFLAIRVAVVGLGKMGISHLAIINALPQFRVVAICDNMALVGNTIERYAQLPYYKNFEEMLRLVELDGLVVATPTGSHEAIVRTAIESGLHVFCEKPLTLSPDASRSIADLARQKGLVAQVGYHNRFIGTFRELKSLIAGGALGKIRHVLAEAYGPVVLKPSKPTWRRKSGGGGGCLYDYAAHPLNLLNWYFGAPQACSGALLKKGFSSEVEDEVYATLGFAEGVTAQLSVNWSDPSARKMTTRISVWGDGGKVVADRQEVHVFLTGSVAIPAGYRSGWNVRYITELTPPVSFYLRGEEYTAQLEAFGNAISGNQNESENGFAGAAETDAAIAMIQVAAAGGDGAAAAEPSPRGRSALFRRVLRG